MMQNNWQRLNIVLSLTDKFNYSDFVAACKEVQCPSICAQLYGQKVGMVMVALNLYPTLEPKDAYLKLLADNPCDKSGYTYTSIDPSTGEDTSGCSTCGGGKVL